MDHLSAACVNSDMGDPATAIGAKEQQIARQHPALRPPSLKLCHCGARHPDTGLVVGVLHQAAAIHPTWRLTPQHIRGSDHSLGGAENALTGDGMGIARGGRRRRAPAQPEQAHK